jgi:hypothetical protein
MKTKYIRYKSKVFGDCILTFPESISHREYSWMVSKQFPGWELISAGFVSLEENKIECYGESETLKIKSLKEDSDILKRQFGG